MLKGETGRFAVKHHEAAHDGTIPNAKTFEMLQSSAPRTRLPSGWRMPEWATALRRLMFNEPLCFFTINVLPDQTIAVMGSLMIIDTLPHKSFHWTNTTFQPSKATNVSFRAISTYTVRSVTQPRQARDWPIRLERCFGKHGLPKIETDRGIKSSAAVQHWPTHGPLSPIKSCGWILIMVDRMAGVTWSSIHAGAVIV